MLEIWQPVATVNAIIFFLIDTPALYAIHRGLLALQGYYLHTRVQAGIKVQLVRSKVPIIGGELLHGTTVLPSVFVLFHLGVLICIFFATLGVDADTRNRWIISSFENITTLSEPRNNRTLFSSEYLSTRNLICKTANPTHADYWNAAFNSNDEGDVRNVSCQADAPHAQPILSAKCVEGNSENECFLGTTPLSYNFKGRLKKTEIRNVTTGPDVSQRIWVEKYEYKGYTSLTNGTLTKAPNDFFGTSGISFAYKTNNHTGGLSNNTGVFFFHNSTTDSWFFSAGQNYGKWRGRCLTPLRLSLHGKTTIEAFFRSAETEETARTIMYSGITHAGGLETSTIDIFEGFLRKSLRGMAPSTPTYVKLPEQQVTILKTRSTVLYSVVISLAILLFPIRELLLLALVRTGKVSRSQLFGYEYNQMSKNFRNAQERLSNASTCTEYAVLNSADPISLG